MIIDEVSFHDSEILSVHETTEKQQIDFVILFPIDWEDNIFEKKILRFSDVTYYCIEEIPFSGTQTILEINNLGIMERINGTGANSLKIQKVKVELYTNAGKRTLEFSQCALLNLSDQK